MSRRLAAALPRSLHPHLKFVVLLREPLSRFLSLTHSLSLSPLSLSFSLSLTHSPSLLSLSLSLSLVCVCVCVCVFVFVCARASARVRVCISTGICQCTNTCKEIQSKTKYSNEDFVNVKALKKNIEKNVNTEKNLKYRDLSMYQHMYRIQSQAPDSEKSVCSAFLAYMALGD